MNRRPTPASATRLLSFDSSAWSAASRKNTRSPDVDLHAKSLRTRQFRSRSVIPGSARITSTASTATSVGVAYFAGPASRRASFSEPGYLPRAPRLVGSAPTPTGWPRERSGIRDRSLVWGALACKQADRIHSMAVIKLCLLLTIATATLTIRANDSEACGGFHFKDKRTDTSVAFHHHATRISLKPKGRKALVWIYADRKNFGVFGIGDTSHEFVVDKAERRKQYWFEGDKLMYKGNQVGRWSPTTLRLGSENFEFVASIVEQHQHHPVWEGSVSFAGQKITAPFRFEDTCQTDWRRSMHKEQLEVTWKRISIYLAAEMIQRNRKSNGEPVHESATPLRSKSFSHQASP